LIERFNSPVDDAAAQALIREFAYIDTDNNLACLLNEQPLVSPGRYLCSQGFERLLHHLRKQFDLVLINTPSILYAPEATAVASLSDAIIAATSYAVRESVVVQLTQQLEAVRRPFLGTIIRADK
jgi:polysaccharide biosynthesis transport protein